MLRIIRLPHHSASTSFKRYLLISFITKAIQKHDKNIKPRKWHIGIWNLLNSIWQDWIQKEIAFISKYNKLDSRNISFLILFLEYNMLKNSRHFKRSLDEWLDFYVAQKRSSKFADHYRTIEICQSHLNSKAFKNIFCYTFSFLNKVDHDKQNPPLVSFYK